MKNEIENEKKKKKIPTSTGTNLREIYFKQSRMPGTITHYEMFEGNGWKRYLSRKKRRLYLRSFPS